MIGNGCRYPLVAEEMARRLAVPFLDERLESFAAGREADVEGAVARGAVLALASQVGGGDLEVQIDLG